MQGFPLLERMRITRRTSNTRDARALSREHIRSVGAVDGSRGVRRRLEVSGSAARIQTSSPSFPVVTGVGGWGTASVLGGEEMGQDISESAVDALASSPITAVGSGSCSATAAAAVGSGSAAAGSCSATAVGDDNQNATLLLAAVAAEERWVPLSFCLADGIWLTVFG
jgi:hypothetical protein